MQGRKKEHRSTRSWKSMRNRKKSVVQVADAGRKKEHRSTRSWKSMRNRKNQSYKLPKEQNKYNWKSRKLVVQIERHARNISKFLAFKGLKAKISVKNWRNQFFQFQTQREEQGATTGAKRRSKELNSGARSWIHYPEHIRGGRRRRRRRRNSVTTREIGRTGCYEIGINKGN